MDGEVKLIGEYTYDEIIDSIAWNALSGETTTIDAPTYRTVINEAWLSNKTGARIESTLRKEAGVHIYTVSLFSGVFKASQEIASMSKHEVIDGFKMCAVELEPKANGFIDYTNNSLKVYEVVF